jgi:hypothetical protein
VRAVRDVTAPPTIPQHFTDNGNGTVTDGLTALVWQKIPRTDTLNWEAALAYADTLTLAGFTDWRLPNIKELQSINDETLVNPSLAPLFSVGTGARQYWSSTTQKGITGNAWYLNTQYGITTYLPKTRNLSVICVRGYQNATLTASNTSATETAATVMPNPAHGSTSIRYFVRDASSVYITICNMVGQNVMCRQIHDFLQGMNFINWQADGLPPGIYNYTISIGHSGAAEEHITGRIDLQN